MKPRALRRASFDFRRARAVMAGVALGVFDALEAGPLSAEEAASTLALDLRGARALLEALTASGVLHRIGDRYAPAGAASSLLAAGGKESRRHVVLHDLWHWGLWARLEDSVRTGAPVADRSGDRFFGDPEVLRRFFPNLAQAMHETSRDLESELPARLDLDGAARLLDLGGGLGNLALALVRRRPGLRAVVLELPPVAAAAEDFLRAEGGLGAVTVRAGDFLRDPLDPEQSGFDRVLLARVLMGLPDDPAISLLTRAREVLRPGGSLAVLEFRPGPVAALLDLDMLLLTGGAVRPPAALRALLAAAGLAVGREGPLGEAGWLLEARPERRA